MVWYRKQKAHGWMDRQIGGKIAGWIVDMDRQLDGQIAGWIDRWMDRQIDRQMRYIVQIDPVDTGRWGMIAIAIFQEKWPPQVLGFQRNTPYLKGPFSWTNRNGNLAVIAESGIDTFPVGVPTIRNMKLAKITPKNLYKHFSLKLSLQRSFNNNLVGPDHSPYVNEIFR